MFPFLSIYPHLPPERTRASPSENGSVSSYLIGMTKTPFLSTSPELAIADRCKPFGKILRVGVLGLE
jgi:hypothetical protein